MRRAYLTDLSDAEWECIKGLLPTPENEGRPRLHSLREILNAIFYVARSGCAWRLLPHDFPPWKTVYHYFRMCYARADADEVSLSLEEASRLLRAATGTRDEALITLTLRTGMRQGELAALRWEHLDLEKPEKGQITVRDSADTRTQTRVSTTKTGEERRIGIGARTVAVLKAHR
jgi:transposase